MIEEHRRFTRVPFKVRAELTASGETHQSDSIDNLSLGGCRLPIKVDLPAGTECLVSIFLTGSIDEISVKMTGEIVRCDSNSISVAFSNIDADSAEHLLNIIMYNCDDPKKIEAELRRHRDTG